LNNAGSSGCNITVVLNDNGMSISPNVGALSKFLLKMQLNPRLSRLKDEIWRLLGESPVGAKRLQRMAGKLEGSLINLITPGMMFEDFGFQYFGPFNGHNLPEIIHVLENVRDNHRHPALVHFVTVKGKGIECAEADPVKYHGIKGKPLPAKVEPQSVAACEQEPLPSLSYMDIFGEAIMEETARDPLIVAVTAAMKDGTGLVPYSHAYPDNFFDVGIAEGHAVTFCAGMATAGLKPVAAIYSTFLQRAYDHVLHDCALPKQPVVFCLDRAGLVGEDGPTHHGCFDLAYLSSIPGMIVAAPRCGQELRDLLHTALVSNLGPFAIRYPRDRAPDTVNWSAKPRRIPVGQWEMLREGRRVLVLAVGAMVETARRAIAHEELNVTLINCRFVKPMDDVLLAELLNRHDAVVTMEEGTLTGGFASRVAMFLQAGGLKHTFRALGIADQFVEHGPRDVLLDLCGLSERHAVETIRALQSEEVPIAGAPLEVVLAGARRR
ncbi:1-deoxy-D-xylulose-5-phosphate synthase, partial [bacterium]|nr:1-deoxy-D-xylulose-5-phosphate synthase [bacterium]